MLPQSFRVQRIHHPQAWKFAGRMHRISPSCVIGVWVHSRQQKTSRKTAHHHWRQPIDWIVRALRILYGFLTDSLSRAG